jgi:hypothetical protein
VAWNWEKMFCLPRDFESSSRSFLTDMEVEHDPRWLALCYTCVILGDAAQVTHSKGLESIIPNVRTRHV